MRRAGATALATQWPGTPRAAGSAETTAAPAVDRLLQERVALQGVGLLAVQTEGARAVLTAAGRETTEGAPLREQAWFEIGSITKTFTALLLADAVVQRQFALGDPVEAALPDGLRLRDSTDAPIRWIDLATHRSGLPRLPTPMAPANPADPYADYGEAQLLDFLRSYRSGQPRDQRWAYSNLGYGLLGYALGRAAGSSYAALLQQRVLGPLGLKDTALQGRQPAPAALVPGHDVQGRAVPHWHFDVMAPAGGLVMSGASLARYAQAAVGAVPHPLQEAFALTRGRHGDGPGPANPVGLAWLHAPLKGRTVFNHDGGTFGFSSSLWLDPDRARATAVLANAMVDVKDLALHLLEPGIPPQDLRATRQPALTLANEQLEPLVGDYMLKPGFALAIRLRNGRLYAQATGQGEFELFASAPRTFFARITPLEIRFDASPLPTALTLLQQGQTLKFERQP